MRLSKIVPDSCTWLEESDYCQHLGEYLSHGTWRAGETNSRISNLKKKPSSSNDGELWHKARAIEYWAAKLRNALNIDYCIDNVTFIPMPCSKPIGHDDYDDRLIKVLRLVDRRLDIRPIIRQDEARDGQHESGRLSPTQLARTMSVDIAIAQQSPIKRISIIFDDVITMGASFKAAQSLLLQAPEFNESEIAGIFLARTIWQEDADLADAL